MNKLFANFFRQSKWPFYVVLVLGAIAVLSGLVTREWIQLVGGIFLVLLGAFGGESGPLHKVRAGPLEAELYERVEKSLDEAIAAEAKTGLADAAAGRDEARKLLGALPAIQPPRILWVDDNPEGNRYEARMLEAIGASLTQVRSTMDGTEQALEGGFDLIISDMTRDGERRAGILFLEGLRQYRVRAPVIFYTYDRDAASVQEALEMGAQAVAHTPGQLMEAVLRTLLAHPVTRSDRR